MTGGYAKSSGSGSPVGASLPLPAGLGGSSSGSSSPRLFSPSEPLALSGSTAARVIHRSFQGKIIAGLLSLVLFILMVIFFFSPSPTHAGLATIAATPLPSVPTLPLAAAASPAGLPLANYAAVIDAGSSGSRIYIYQYRLPFADDYVGIASTNATRTGGAETGAGKRTGDPTADLLHIAIAEDSKGKPVIKKQEPGLSAFGSRPHDAFSSIRPLLDYAAAHIPPALVPSTPVYVLATAGLRLLPAASRDAVLQSVRVGLKKEAAQGRFLYESDSQVNVISGEEEGLYGWVALNYLRNRFGDLEHPYPTGGLDPKSFAVLPTPPVHPYYLPSRGTDTSAAAAAAAGTGAAVGAGGSGKSKPPMTVGLVEIGGGSAQIAFEAPDVVDIDIDGDGIPDPGTGVPHPPDYVFHLDLDLVKCSDSDDPPSSTTTAAGGAGVAPTVEGMTGAEALRRAELARDAAAAAATGAGAAAAAGASDAVTVGRLGKGGHKYSVYTASFLGFGANSARDRYVARRLAHARTAGQHHGAIRDPCLLEGQQQMYSSAAAEKGEPLFWGKSVALEEQRSDEDIARDEKHFTFIGTGDWLACRDALVPLLDAEIPCPFPCPFGGRYQPTLTPEVLSRHFFAFSEYWYSTRDVLQLDPTAFSGRALESASLALCQRGRNSITEAETRLRGGGYSQHTTAERLRQQCFKAAWLDTVLFRGHGFPRDLEQSVRPVSTIEGTEVQWSLGALLVLVTDKVKKDAGYCRALQRNHVIADAHVKASLLHTATGHSAMHKTNATDKPSSPYGSNAPPAWLRLAIAVLFICGGVYAAVILAQRALARWSGPAPEAGGAGGAQRREQGEVSSSVRWQPIPGTYVGEDIV